MVSLFPLEPVKETDEGRKVIITFLDEETEEAMGSNCTNGNPSLKALTLRNTKKVADALGRLDRHVMKRSLFVFAGIFLLACNCFSQYQVAGLDRAKKVGFFQSDRVGVRAIFHDFELDDYEYSDEFSSADASVEVFYSTGECDEDEDEIWDVSKGKVTRIEIDPDAEIRFDELGIDLSKFLKEQIYFAVPDELIYHDKKAGFAIEVSEDIVTKLILFPSVSSRAKTCKFEAAKDFVSEESWFGRKKLEERKIKCCIDVVANVTGLLLDREEITAISSKEIAVSVAASDPENDPLVYVYNVSGGKIVGTGQKVVWNLTGVGPGTYKITAGVDDGCGICGQTVTKTVTVK